MTLIHPTAIISKGAQIDTTAEIGPYCVIGAEVSIGKNTRLLSHVCIEGRTSIGENNTIYPFASLGHAPQDLKYHGEPSTLSIGDNNVIREYVTMNPGTEGGGMKTVVGNYCLFMVSAHVAHDCHVGNHVILANNATLAGHVTVEDNVIVGGLAAVHQFVRIGANAIIGGMSGVEHDVIPYGSVMGERASLSGLNLIGLKRKGFDRETIHALRNAYKELFEDNAGTLSARTEQVKNTYADVDAVQQVIAFMQAQTQRQLCVPKSSAA